jgi:hypothetical protein
MLKLSSFFRKLYSRQPRVQCSNEIIVNGDKNCDFGKELQNLIQEAGYTATIIDARTLYDSKDLKAQLATIPDGALIIDHLTEVPEGEKQDIIQNILYFMLKGDWKIDWGSNHLYASEWEEHIAHTNLKVYGIISDGNLKDRTIPSGACQMAAYGDCGHDLCRIDEEDEE